MTADNAPEGSAPDTIVLIHGLWVEVRGLAQEQGPWGEWVD
jgi:hypothetical protein